MHGRFWLPLAFLFSTYCSAATELPKNSLYRNADETQSIKVTSSEELEFTQGKGPHLVCKYSIEGDSLRVVATILGTTTAQYFQITDEGLRSHEGMVFYDSEHFGEANRAARAEAEARRLEIERADAVRNAALKQIEVETKNRKSTLATGSMSISSAKALAVYAPRPAYPFEARSRRITGSGVVAVTVDTASGRVTDATMAQSIGNASLDNSVVSAFRQWRFKPGTVAKIRIPVTFTMAGASY